MPASYGLEVDTSLPHVMSAFSKLLDHELDPFAIPGLAQLSASPKSAKQWTTSTWNVGTG